MDGGKDRLNHWNWVPENDKHLLTVKQIGIACDGIEKGKILESFITD
jgi:hypothetical protein